MFILTFVYQGNGGHLKFTSPVTTTWTAPYFEHTYLGFRSIKSNGFFTKTKEAILYFVITTILEQRRTRSCLKVQFLHGTLD
jgi:hypothetical protein